MILDETLKDGEMRIYKDLHNGWVEEQETINVRQYGKIYQTMKEMQQQITQLTNNWNELEEWLKKENEYSDYKDVFYREHMGYVLDKMKEIKEGNNK